MLHIMFMLAVCTAKVFEPLAIFATVLLFIQFAVYQISGISLYNCIQNWILKGVR